MEWAWFAAATVGIVAIALVFSWLTTRTLERELEMVPTEGPLDPSTLLGMSRQALYANAALSQAFLLMLVWGAVVLTTVEWGAIGLPGAMDLPLAIAAGVGVGVVLAVINESLQWGLDRAAIPYDESLRLLMTPSSRQEWFVLLVLVLPIVAAFEELLFRGAMIGGLAVGVTVSPWVLVLLSSVVFALGHSLQGIGGLLAAGVLGLLLGGAFVIADSLVLVIVAHYVVNVIEFVRHRHGR